MARLRPLPPKPIHIPRLRHRRDRHRPARHLATDRLGDLQFRSGTAGLYEEVAVLDHPEKDQNATEEDHLGRKVAGGAIGGAVGGIVGGLAGLIVAGPFGALGGSVVGNTIGNASAPLVEHAFRRASAEFVQRQLSSREEGRIVSVLSYVARKVESNIAAGLTVRSDEFFEEAANDRSSADELFEAVLLCAQKEYQEKKLRFYGNLLTNIAFHPEISRAQANLLIRLAEQLSYRQLCLLHLLADNVLYPGKYPDQATTLFSDWKVEGSVPAPHWALISELYQLYSQGYLRYSYSIAGALLYPLDLVLDFLHSTDLTNTLRLLMELDQIDANDLDEVGSLLLGPAKEKQQE